MVRLQVVGMAAILAAGACTQPVSQITGRLAKEFAGQPQRRYPRHYTCQRAATPVRIDGRLNEAEWAVAPWSAAFMDIEGPEALTPRFKTHFQMQWDDDYLYIAALLDEPHVWATLTEHDQIVFHDNDFEVFLDPDGDGLDYYEVEINALNTIFDLRLTKAYNQGGKARHEWHMTGMRSAVHVDGTLNDPSDIDRAWSVEMAFPWTTLAEYTTASCPPKPGDTWRINFSRVQWHHTIEDGAYRKVPDTREDNWSWTPQWKINMHIPGEWGHLKFERERQ